MSQAIPEVVNQPRITSAEFVKLKIFNDYNNVNDTSTYTFSSAYKRETINGQEYLPLGGLLEVGSQSRNLAVTSGDTIIALSGISGNNMNVVLGTKIRGSEIEVYRGFYDDNMILGNSYLRFTGIITSYNIIEDYDDKTDNFSVAVAASSYKTVLQNRIAGRKTNSESWKFFDPTDTSMDRVYSISNVQFDFGQEPTARRTAPGATGAGSSSPNPVGTFIQP